MGLFDLFKKAKPAVVKQEPIKSTVPNAGKTSHERLRKYDPELYNRLETQEQQLDAIQKARKEYDENKDINSYIAFWEMLWKKGGLVFRGSRWHFELADLYISAKMYDDALRFVKKLKRERKEYAEKADSYIAKIEGLIAKQASKNGN